MPAWSGVDIRRLGLPPLLGCRFADVLTGSHATDNLAEGFWSYSVNRFERCYRLMADPAFERAVASI